MRATSKKLKVVTDQGESIPCVGHNTPPDEFDASKLRVGRLDSVGAVISEMGKLYRRTARRQVPHGESKVLREILVSIREALEQGEFERRLRVLEEQE